MSISAVLLAGGESRRMGSNKANLQWQGRPSWEWQVEKLRALSLQKIFLSARGDAPWRPMDIELVVDASPSRGPMSGLAATLAVLDTDHLLVLAIDMPFMTTEHLRYLRSLATTGIGVVPMIDGNAEPLAAIYPRKAWAVFRDALETENFSLQPIVRKLIADRIVQAVSIPVQSREYYRNINQPADLA